MGLKEILAARKAKEEQDQIKDIQTITSKNVGGSDFLTDVIKEESKKKEISPLEAMGLDPTVSKAEEAAPPKPMSFAEKMALKKAALTKAEAPVPVEASEILSARLVETAKKLAPVELTEEQKAVIENAEDKEAAQAYSDIALKLNELSRTEEGEDLTKAMATLKKALKENPSASLLVLDSDIGQMVLGLTRMTQVEFATASEPKKRGPAKAKNVALSAEQIEAAWNEL